MPFGLLLLRVRVEKAMVSSQQSANAQQQQEELRRKIWEDEEYKSDGGKKLFQKNGGKNGNDVRKSGSSFSTYLFLVLQQTFQLSP
jgi:hypothetical protein